MVREGTGSVTAGSPARQAANGQDQGRWPTLIRPTPQNAQRPIDHHGRLHHALTLRAKASHRHGAQRKQSANHAPSTPWLTDGPSASNGARNPRFVWGDARGAPTAGNYFPSSYASKDRPCMQCWSQYSWKRCQIRCCPNKVTCSRRALRHNGSDTSTHCFPGGRRRNGMAEEMGMRAGGQRATIRLRRFVAMGVALAHRPGPPYKSPEASASEPPPRLLPNPS